MNTLRKIGITLTLLAGMQPAIGQITKSLAEDFDLKGYPKKVHITAYDPKERADSLISGEQRKSFTDDYIMEFNQQRELTDRQNFIQNKKDRYAKYAYDNKRHLTSEVLYEANGRKVSISEYRYDLLGRLTEVLVTDFPQSLDGVNTVREHYTMEYKNRLPVKKSTFYNGTLGITTEYTYGTADSLILEVSTYHLNKNVERIVYRRDFRNIVVEKTHSRNDKQIRRETYTLSKTNLLLEKDVFDGNDQLRHKYKYTYDKWGNLLSEKGHDRSGKVTTEYYFKYTYDKNLNWTQRVRYDAWTAHRIEEREIEYWNKMHFDDYLRDNSVIIDSETKQKK